MFFSFLWNIVHRFIDEGCRNGFCIVEVCSLPLCYLNVFVVLPTIKEK